MGKPAATQGDMVVGIDIHVVMIPSPGGPIPTPLPSPFVGQLSDVLSATVMIDNQAVAIVGSTADNSPPHIPAGGPFQKTPADKATVQQGSTTVMIDGKGVARLGDPAMTCNDPADAPNGAIIAAGTVFVGD